MSINEIIKKSKTLKKAIVDKDVVKKFYTGNPLLDVFTAGGIPHQRFTLFYGKKGTFKSTLTVPLFTSIYNQVDLPNSVFILLDTENAFDVIRWKLLGFPVDADNFIVISPSAGEEIPSIIQEIKKENPDLELYILWDSIAATPSAEEVESDTNKIGVLARMLSRLFRVINFRNDKITLIGINQFRESMMMFQSTETPGGNAVQHKPDLICQISVSNSDIIPKELGRMITIHSEKNRMASPYRKLRLIALYSTGIDTLLSVIMYALEGKIIEKARKPKGEEEGTYFSVPYSEKIKSLKELQYDLLVNPEAYIIWEYALNTVADLYKDDSMAYDIIKEKMIDIINYYFNNGVLDVNKLTMLNYIRKLEIINPEMAEKYKNEILKNVKDINK